MISDGSHDAGLNWREAAFSAAKSLLAAPEWWVTCALVVAVAVSYHGFIDNYSSLWRWFFLELKYDVIGVLYLIPLAYAAVRLGLSGFVLAWLLSFLFLLPRLSRWAIDSLSIVFNTFFFLLVLVIGTATMLALLWRARHESLTRERELERQMHIEHVYRAQEEERQRIAQDLHDDVLQRLLAIGYTLEAMSEDLASLSPRLSNQAAIAREDSVRLASDLRRLSYDLRPSILDELGLYSAAEWLLARLQTETAIHATFLQVGSRTRFADGIETAAFRTIQEALSNVRRHSKASRVDVRISAMPCQLMIEIEDDGVGFDAEDAVIGTARNGQLGLLGMRWRVNSLEGSFSIQSELGCGTRVVIAIPVKDATHGH
jgi:signal transduction histidine kinase